jgi:hypothetical protein
MDSQEWLSANAHRRFPFAEASASATGVDLDVLSDWVLDLRVFVSPHEEVDCWISAIAWTSGDPLSLGSELITINGEAITIGPLTPDNLTCNGQDLILNGQPLIMGGPPTPENLTCDGQDLILNGQQLIIGNSFVLEGGMYVIELSNSTGVIATFAFTVQDIFGSPDYQTKRYAFSGRMVAILSPGKNWNNPASIGVTESQSITFVTDDEIESTRIHPTNVNTDIRSFKGFYLAAPFYDADGVLVEEDELVPDVGESPPVSVNKLRAGYNIKLGKSGDFLDMNLVPGAGDGLYPCQETNCKPKVRTINGLSPTEAGDIALEFIDCLRYSGRTDIDPLTTLPNIHGIKIYSDCTACCTCSDYNNTGLSIGRMSAKFKEVNKDMINILLKCQELYDEAVTEAMKNSPGMAVAYQVQVFADRAEVSILNNSNVPIYAIVGIKVNPLGDVSLVEGGNYTSGAITSAPPLTGLADTNQGTGVIDPNDLACWKPGDFQITLGSDGFGPIPPATISKFTLESELAKEKLKELQEICAKLQIFLGGSLGQSVVDGDPQYQGFLTQFGTLAIVAPDCLGTDFPGEGYNIYSESYDDRFRCNVQAQADSLVRQELRDEMLARKYELAFDLEICGESMITAGMTAAIASLRGLKNMLSVNCKDGTHTCEDRDSTGGNYRWQCRAPLYEDVCQGQIRRQNIERAKVYALIEKELRDQIYRIRQKIEECLSDGMFADLVNSIEISTLAVYGSEVSIGCGCGNSTFDINRTDPINQGYDCLSELISVVALSTQKPIIGDPPLPDP